jgi:transposase
MEANVFFAGIDAHTRYVVVVVINSSGEKVLGPTRVKVEQTDRLLALLAPYRPLDAVMETSSSWPWLHEVLSGAGITFVLAHARRLRAIAEANYKSDDIDAELLARMRLARLIPEVYPTSAEQREWTTLLRHRATLIRQRTALANRVHAQLHLRGLHLKRGRLLTRAGRQWVRTEAWPHLELEQRAVVRSHFRLMAGLRRLIRAVDRHIAQVAATIPQAQVLCSITGIGPHRALTLCAEALPITRFRTPGHLASYAGLVPCSKQSGERPVRHGQIPRGANRWLRGTLVRIVVSHVQHAPDSWLTQYYVAQKARLGWPTARVAAARKLVRAIHAMLRTNTRWTDPSRHTPSSLPSSLTPSLTPSRGELHEPHAGPCVPA